MSRSKKEDFYKTYVNIAKQYGIEPNIAEGLELDSFTFIERRKVRRDHAVTVRLSAHDLNRLEAICQATKASKTTVICRLIFAASRFVPECPEAYRKEATYRRRVTVKTRVTHDAKELPPPRKMSQQPRKRAAAPWTAFFWFGARAVRSARLPPASLSTAHSAPSGTPAIMFAAP